MAPNSQVVFTGLCSFLNVRNTNSKMPAPSVILVRAADPAMPSMDHTPFLAYDTRIMKVSNASGFKPVTLPVPHIDHSLLTGLAAADLAKLNEADKFHFLPLDGYEIVIEGDAPATPNVDASYDEVAKKDTYWPASTNQWDPRYVPKPGNKPDPSVVAAYLRFGKGTITAGRISENEWEFRDPVTTNITTHGKYAREVGYSNIPIAGNGISITLYKLGTTEVVNRLSFTPLNGGPPAVWIGNNMDHDIGFAVQRVSLKVLGTGQHFQFLNRIVPGGHGPIPQVVLNGNGGGHSHHAPLPLGPTNKLVGAAATGYCGPGTGNG